MKSEKILFARNFVTKYFFYGYLCLIGTILVVMAAFVTFRHVNYPYNFFTVLYLVPFISVFGQFCRILGTTGYKFRYFKISLYRLKTRGYKDSYFECEMHEPCFRLMIKDILCSLGYSNEYKLLREKCRGKNLRVERAKENLLKKVQAEHKK